MWSQVARRQENKNYTVHRRYFRCWDEDNPIPRVGQKEADAIPGTMSHYCFAAISAPGKMQLRQYSCYCNKCSNGLYSECPFKEVVRSRKHEPKRGGAARKRWMEEGWVEYMMKLRDDRARVQSRLSLRLRGPAGG